MQLRVGYDFRYDFPQPTPLILTLNVHYSRASDIIAPDHMKVSPSTLVRAYRDGFGNWCNRIVAGPGPVRIWAEGLVNDNGQADLQQPGAMQHPVEQLPAETLVFLLGSRYCETDKLSELAWSMFSGVPAGWARVQAICNFVHGHITFGYEFASPSKSAFDVYNERRGVCRDYAHLAVALCRCMNIPARYCTGYLSDVGQPPPYSPMDFAGWFEAYLGGQWHTFDPRNNTPRLGRVLIARGRDAADVALNTTFGPNELVSFTVITEEVTPGTMGPPYN